MGLSLEMFVGAYRDFESRQYQILGELGKARNSFSHNRIYPSLAELLDLYGSLRAIVDRTQDIRGALPKRIAGIDLNNRRIVYEPLDLNQADLQAIEDLIHWALPHIQQAIEEGRTIFNFVDENLKLGEVGIIPSYVEEGYLLVPDVRAGLLHVIRYEVTIFTGAEERYRNLKTTSLKSVPLRSLQFSPVDLKHELIGEHRELPNPATYLIETDLDFPFQETILPVAKRKFLRQLYS
jgi:hypothetical protein